MWIQSLFDDGDCLRPIVAKTGRNVSLISREISRNARRSGVCAPPACRLHSRASSDPFIEIAALVAWLEGATYNSPTA